MAVSKLTEELLIKTHSITVQGMALQSFTIKLEHPKVGNFSYFSSV